MAVTHKTIIRRFVEGLTLEELSKKYALADWEVEEALRSRLRAKVPMVQEDLVLDPASRQLSIEEVYGTIKI